MKIIAIMQPTYLPWVGYFDLIDRVDKFVFLDDAKVSKQSWGVRNRIWTAHGERYLTVPLRSYRDHDNRLFTNTQIDYNRDWQAKHLKTIAHSYSKASHFESVYADLESLLSVRHLTIGDLNMSLIRRVVQRVGIITELLRSSEIPNTLGQKDERLASICRVLGASDYLSPQGSAGYIEKNRPGGALTAAGIGLWYHNYVHPEYPQRGVAFISHMAIVDLLMNCGYDSTLDVIRSGRRKMLPFAQFREGFSESSENHVE